MLGSTGGQKALFTCFWKGVDGLQGLQSFRITLSFISTDYFDPLVCISPFSVFFISSRDITVVVQASE